MSKTAKIIIAVVIIALASYGIYVWMKSKKTTSAPTKKPAEPKVPAPGKTIVDGPDVVTLDAAGIALSRKPISQSDISLG